MYKIGDLVENRKKVIVMRDREPYHIPAGTTLRVTGTQGGIIQARCHYDDFGPLFFTTEQVAPALITCW